MKESNLRVVLDFSEAIIDHADLLVEVFDSKRPFSDKMDFLFEWMTTFRDDLENHPCKRLIQQLRNEIEPR